MTTEEFQAAVIGELRRVGDELAGIRLALGPTASAPAGDPAPAPEACSHPQDSRVELSGMGGVEEFFCRACETQVRLEPAKPAGV